MVWQWQSFIDNDNFIVSFTAFLLFDVLSQLIIQAKY
jgi:hypothetical protein